MRGLPAARDASPNADANSLPGDFLAAALVKALATSEAGKTTVPADAATSGAAISQTYKPVVTEPHNEAYVFVWLVARSTATTIIDEDIRREGAGPIVMDARSIIWRKEERAKPEDYERGLKIITM